MRVLYHVVLFQSLIGRLGTRTWRSERPVFSTFQSLIGRLGTGSETPWLPGMRAVSIPHR